MLRKSQLRFCIMVTIRASHYLKYTIFKRFYLFLYVFERERICAHICKGSGGTGGEERESQADPPMSTEHKHGAQCYVRP